MTEELVNSGDRVNWVVISHTKHLVRTQAGLRKALKMYLGTEGYKTYKQLGHIHFGKPFYPAVITLIDFYHGYHGLQVRWKRLESYVETLQRQIELISANDDAVKQYMTTRVNNETNTQSESMDTPA